MFQNISEMLSKLNAFRLLPRWQRVDYVLFNLPKKLPALPEPRRPWLLRRLQGDPPMSLRELDEAFQGVAKDKRTKGVILKLRGASMGMADLQTLRTSISTLRKSGKRVVAYSSSGYDLKTYFVASVADEILMQPSGSLIVPGLCENYPFMKDALAKIGVKMEIFPSHPYKCGGDVMAFNSPTSEFCEEYNRLMDSCFGIYVEGIAQGRNVEQEAVKTMIDGALYMDTEAKKAGYIDGLVHEEDLPRHLGVKHILTWDKAKKLLRKQWRKYHRKYVALVRIEGMIIDGESSKPPGPIPVPFSGFQQWSGDITVVQHLRQVMKDKRAAALVLYVDSPGGSATASEAMAAALRRFNKDRPVVVYMNNIAGSGGYWVSTPGRWIVAQPGTITGSVGALMGKLISQDMFSKLHINLVESARGKNATLLSGNAPSTDAQRTLMQGAATHCYKQFAALVASSRKLDQEKIEAACCGRIWTGVHALEHGLVDELGGLDTALDKARELAGLPDDAPLVIPTIKRKPPIPPDLVREANPVAIMNYMDEGVRTVCNGKAQALMPFILE